MFELIFGIIWLTITSMVAIPFLLVGISDSGMPILFFIVFFGIFYAIGITMLRKGLKSVARNKATDKNEVAVLYGLDKIFRMEKVSGIVLCMAFAKADQLGYKGGFESTKEFLTAMTDLDIKTVNSRINVGRTLFDLNGEPVVHRLLDFEWSKALEMVTIKKNDTNSDKAGLEQLNAYIDAGYITPTTPLAKLKKWKVDLATGYIPKEWVAIDTSTNPITFSWYEADGYHYTDEAPYPEEKGNTGKAETGKAEKGKAETGKAETGKAEAVTGDNESNVTVVSPVMLLDGFTVAVDDLKMEMSEDDRKKYERAVKQISEIFKKYEKAD